MTSRRYVTPSQRTASSFSDASQEGFQKLFVSVADPQSKRNHARHLALSKNILYENEAGWKVAQLPLVGELFHLLRSKICNGAPQFTELLVLAVTNCCKPFVRQKSNEEITNSSSFHFFLPSLSELLSFESIEVQVAAAEALRVFATGACLLRPVSKSRGKNTKTHLDDLRLTPRTFSQNLLVETGTVHSIVAVMHDLFADGEFGNEGHEFEQIWEDTELREDQPSTDSQYFSTRLGEVLMSNEEIKAEIYMGMEDMDTADVDDNRDAKDVAFEYSKQDSTDAKETEENMNVAQSVIRHKSALAYEHTRSSQFMASRMWKSERIIIGDKLRFPYGATRPASAPCTMQRGFNDKESKAETISEKFISEDYEGSILNQYGNRDSRPHSAHEMQCLQDIVEEDNEHVIKDAPPLELRLSSLLFSLIEFISELSAHARCAEVLVVSGTLHYVVFLLDKITNSQDELMPLCLEILWNVLEISQGNRSTITRVGSRKELHELFRLKDANFFLANQSTLQALLHVIRLLLAHGYRQQDKEMRNECMMILYLLAKRRLSLDYFYSTGLTACLFSYATSAELSLAKASSHFSFPLGKPSATASAILANKLYDATSSDEDLEFKQMLWYLLAEISYDHEANLSELVQFRYIEIWLSYATATHHQGTSISLDASAHTYSIPQLQLLQKTAQNVLNHVASFVVDHFYEISGHVKLLAFLQLNKGTDDVLASTWLLLLQVSRPVPYFQSELRKLGAIESAIEIFAAHAPRHTFIVCRNAILVCACMCRNDDGSNRERFRRANGVYNLVQHLDYHPSYSVLEENVLVGILEAVRSCVIGDIESETAFINYEGVPKLLLIIQVAPKALKHQALAALAEICVNPLAIPSYEMWRCNQPGEMKNASANEVLLRLYADEEAAEKRTNQDIFQDSIADTAVFISACHNVTQSFTFCKNLADIATGGSTLSEIPELSLKRPESPAFARLNDALKAAQGLTPGGRSAYSLGGMKSHHIDPVVNLKSRIYAVLANVSFSCKGNNLSPQDQVMLEIVKEYPTFKIEEMWQIVEQALYVEGVRPIYADALYIRKMIEQANNISVCTKLAQQEIFAQFYQQNLKSENAFYEKLLLQKHQESQVNEFHCACRQQNSTMKLHLDAKKTRVEFMRRQDPVAFAAYERDTRCVIRDPPPEYVDEHEGQRTLPQHETQSCSRLSTTQKLTTSN